MCIGAKAFTILISFLLSTYLDSDTSTNYTLRLYGAAALRASAGCSRVTRGSIVFLNQCYLHITSKNDISLQKREMEGNQTENTTLQQNKINPSFQPLPLSIPLPLPLSVPSYLPHGSVNQLNKKNEVLLKLNPSSGSIHLLIVNGADFVGRGMGRGAYPKLFRHADILSVWCEQNPSLSLSRCFLSVQNGIARFTYSALLYGISCTLTFLNLSTN